MDMSAEPNFLNWLIAFPTADLLERIEFFLVKD